MRFCKESDWLLKSPFDLKICVILFYRLKVNYRAGFVQVTFGYNTNSGGLGIFSLLK